MRSGELVLIRDRDEPQDQLPPKTTPNQAGRNVRNKKATGSVAAGGSAVVGAARAPARETGVKIKTMFDELATVLPGDSVCNEP